MTLRHRKASVRRHTDSVCAGTRQGRENFARWIIFSILFPLVALPHKWGWVHQVSVA